ncbi:hypothetical protein LUZ61_006976 [Rhynchospora tenuis]|uniref:Dirigent protein n=1 Tax=Rhynchospora tenuis TaxID=198213 RepID=A0AAD6EW34_9POAL|nr:hypothetical protein LUZ61_006976 [Rhynchospora tenuis]
MEIERHTRKHRIPWLVLSILVAFNHGTAIARPRPRPNRNVFNILPAIIPATTAICDFTGFAGSYRLKSFSTEAGKLKFINQKIRGEGDIDEPLIGQVEGVQVTSLGDSTSSILALEASFASTTGETEDSLRFFGVHHTDGAESQIAVVGGKGKYEEASGFAVIKGGGGPESSGNDFGFTVYLE